MQRKQLPPIYFLFLPPSRYAPGADVKMKAFMIMCAAMHCVLYVYTDYGTIRRTLNYSSDKFFGLRVRTEECFRWTAMPEAFFLKKTFTQ